MKAFHTIADVLDSAWGAIRPEKPEQADRVLKSTRLEDSIYADLRGGDLEMEALEASASEKLRSFPALSRDVYQSFYSLNPRRNAEETLTAAARKFNAHILDHVMQNEDYSTIKSICEGRELPAYEAASEFIQQVSGELDGLLKSTGGEKNALNTLEKLEGAQNAAQKELSQLLERLQSSTSKSGTLEQAVVNAANKAESKQRQVQAVSKMVDTSLTQNKGAVEAAIDSAIQAACEKAEEVQNIIGAWSDEPGGMERTPMNMELLAQVRKSQTLVDISKYLGRFREIFAQGRKNGYAFGRGEKYSLELGNDLSRALTSELALLAAPETIPLFLQKYQRGQIKQYQRREPIYKGAGDVIVCIDESDSTRGDPEAWAKAVAMTLLEIAMEGHRKFALIHFSGGGRIKTDRFLPGAFDARRRLDAAECFLGGGTNFETPLREALRLMEEESFENADIVFITDGECALPQPFADQLRECQTDRKFTVTGILLDSGCAGMEFSLKGFCQKLYRTSQLTGDEIAVSLISDRS